MDYVVNIDGRLCGPDDAVIPVVDRGFLYGDSVYEVIRTYDGRLFALGEHLDRLSRSAQRLFIDLPERDWLEEQVRGTLQHGSFPESYCRIIVTRGSGPITLDPTTAEKPRTIILVKPFVPYPAWMYENGIKILIPSVRRTPPASLDPAIKSGNYLNSILALGEARRAGYDDALMLDTQGRVTEFTAANVFVWKDQKLLTPALETGILDGVTRGILLFLARSGGLPCLESFLSQADLEAADEVLLTSTLREVLPVVRINEHSVGTGLPGPVTRSLHKRFLEYVSDRILKDHTS